VNPNPSDLPPTNNQDPNSQDLEVDQAIAETEALLTEVKDRYAQIRTAKADLAPLKQQQRQLKKQLSNNQQREWHDRQAIKEERAQVENRLLEIAIELESNLISWQSFREPFWQILRFGGIGIIVGWYLRDWTS
jgi:chromosome segregation ATPase